MLSLICALSQLKRNAVAANEIWFVSFAICKKIGRKSHFNRWYERQLLSVRQTYFTHLWHDIFHWSFVIQSLERFENQSHFHFSFTKDEVSKTSGRFQNLSWWRTSKNKERSNIKTWNVRKKTPLQKTSLFQTKRDFEETSKLVKQTYFQTAHTHTQYESSILYMYIFSP